MSVHLESVSEFLASHLGGKVTALEMLVGGDWSQAFGFQFDGRDLVARFGAHVDDFEKDRVATRFSCADLPIPEVLEIGAAFDGFFCISHRVFGEMLDALDTDEMKRAIPAVLRTLDALRLADFGLWAAELGAPTVSWAEQLLSVDGENERVFGWHDALRESPTGIEPFRKGLAYLEAHVAACPEGNHLLHNDLLHRNVTVVDDKITGVFDWGCAGRGDFLYELAFFTFYTPWFPAMAAIDWKGEARRHYAEIGLDVPDFDERLRCYEVHIGLSGMAYNGFIRDWDDLKAHTVRTLERFDGVDREPSKPQRGAE